MPVLVSLYGATSYYCKRISTATDMGQRTTGISREDHVAKSIVRATGTALCIGETETRQQNGTQRSTGDMNMNMSKTRRIEICRLCGVVKSNSKKKYFFVESPDGGHTHRGLRLQQGVLEVRSV